MYLSDLFKKLYQKDPVLSELYPSGYLDSDSLTHAHSRRFDYPRQSEFLQALQSELISADIPESSKQNARLLMQPQSRVIITGQQPMLFGGPLFVIYKAMTCITWAHQASVALGVPVIPVFWIAGDDSDLKECNYSEDLLRGTLYSLKYADVKAPILMSQREYTQAHLYEIEQILQNLKSPEVLTLFKGLYAKGQNPAGVMAKLLYRLFPDSGLICFDPSDPAIAPYTQVFLRTFLSHQNVYPHLVRNQAALKALEIDPGVQIDPYVPRLFAVRTGRRHRVANPELIPDHLSHDVLSRPLLCDHLFPVLAHVLGPGELRYFGLLSGVYQSLGIPFPLIASRMHAELFRTQFFNPLYDLLKKSPESLYKLNSTELKSALRKSSALFDQVPQVRLVASNQQEDLESIPGFTPQALIKSFNQQIIRAMEKALFSKKHPVGLMLQEFRRWHGNGRQQERYLSLLNFVELVGANLHKFDLNPTSPLKQNIFVD
jgi:uncharacterized protein YllA (UPF0747 family)